MRRGAAALTIAVALLVVPAQLAQAAHPRLVYRVDRVTAHMAGHKLIVEASGAVATGGWQKPRLRVVKPSAPETPVVVLEFIANPPGPKQIVIQALLPVSAHLTIDRLRYHASVVSITTQTNGIATQITGGR